MLPSSVRRAWCSHYTAADPSEAGQVDSGGATTQPRNFEQRLTFLEQQMQELRELPDRVERMESQILQFRTEMKDGFSAIRTDLRAELHGVETGLRTELHDVRDALRSEIREVRDTLRSEIHEVRDTLKSEIADVREDIRIGVEESQNLTKGLHADALQAVSAVETAIRRDVVARLDQLLEGQRGASG